MIFVEIYFLIGALFTLFAYLTDRPSCGIRDLMIGAAIGLLLWPLLVLAHLLGGGE